MANRSKYISFGGERGITVSVDPPKIDNGVVYLEFDDISSSTQRKIMDIIQAHFNQQGITTDYDLDDELDGSITYESSFGDVDHSATAMMKRVVEVLKTISAIKKAMPTAKVSEIATFLYEHVQTAGLSLDDAMAKLPQPDEPPRVDFKPLQSLLHTRLKRLVPANDNTLNAIVDGLAYDISGHRDWSLENVESGAIPAHPLYQLIESKLAPVIPKEQLAKLQYFAREAFDAVRDTFNGKASSGRCM